MANDENIAAKVWREMQERANSPNGNAAAKVWREMQERANNPNGNAAARAWRETKANLVGYRAGREPDASWYRPSNHRPPVFPSTYEQVADEKRKAEQARVKEFFYNFLKNANDAQIAVFRKVMEDPTIEGIRALLSIPYIPQMMREEKEKEKEKWDNTSDRDFCREFTKNNQKLFEECLRDLYKKKQNQSIGPTQ